MLFAFHPSRCVVGRAHLKCHLSYRVFKKSTRNLFHHLLYNIFALIVHRFDCIHCNYLNQSTAFEKNPPDQMDREIVLILIFNQPNGMCEWVFGMCACVFAMCGMSAAGI